MERRIMGNFGGIIHGGDYNPDQWLDRPEILEEDLAADEKGKRQLRDARHLCVEPSGAGGGAVRSRVADRDHTEIV